VRRYVGWFAGSVLVSFVLAWVYVVAAPSAFMNDTYLFSRVQKERIAACDMPDIAVFGDSRAVVAFVPSLITVAPTANFAVAGTTPIETYFAVEQAMQCPKLPRWVVIAHGARVFSNPSGFWTQDSLRGFLTTDQRQEVQREAARLNDFVSIGPLPDDGFPPFARDWLYSIHFPSLFFAHLLNAGIVLRWPHNHEAMTEIRRSRGQTYFGGANGTNRTSPEIDMTHFTAKALPRFYFVKTLALLESHGIETIFVGTPLNQATFDHVGPDVGPEFLSYLQTVTAAFPHVQVSPDVLPCWPNTYFGDPAHFNRSGAEAYSREFNDFLVGALAGKVVGNLPDHCQRTGGLPAATMSSASLVLPFVAVQH
jgi:hypothetical protein